jgi:hypothetical protein
VATTGVIASTVFVFLGLACGVPCSVAAQVDLQLVPFAGRYVPNGILVPGTSVRHNPGLTLGTRATWWLTNPVGIEGTVSFALSRVSSATPGWESAQVLSFDITPVVRVSPPGPLAFHMGAGLGLVDHVGDAFLYARGRTVFFSGIVRAGAALKLGWAPWKALRFDAEYYVYHSRFDTCQRTVGIFCGAMNLTVGSTAPELQRDLVLSVGLAVRVAGH